MTSLAAIRPDEWNLPLLLHVFGAMVLVGALVTVVAALVVAWPRARADEALTLYRTSFWTLLAVGLPALVLMRMAGQWIASEENVEELDVAWIEIGYVTGDLGIPVFLVTTILAGIGVYRARRNAEQGGTLLRIAAVLAAILLAAYLVAMWAMTVKPD